MATKNDKTDDAKVFDVEKPGKSKPPMGSKPMIVGHKTMAGDPMVKLDEDGDKTKATEEERERMARNSSKLKIEPISDKLKVEESKAEDSKEDTANEKVAKKETKKSDEKSTEKKEDESDDKKKEKELDPAAVDMEREENLNKIIKSKKYQVDIKESRPGSLKTFLIVFLSLLVAGFVTLFVLIDTNTIKTDIDLPFRIFGSEESEQQTTTTVIEEPEQAPEEIVKPKILDLEEPIVLEKLGDEVKLPEETPSSFVLFMKSKLTTIETDCPIVQDEILPGYSVSKISDRYIEGSGSCGGSGHMDWYFLDDVWNELPQQSYVDCSKVIETTIPTEFMESCLSNENQELIDNPNGSYYDQEI